MADETVALIERAKDGDEAALQRLLVTHYTQLDRLIEARLPRELRDHLGQADIRQATLRIAYQKISQFTATGEGSFLAWLSQIAEFEIRDQLKKHRALKAGGRRARVAAEAQSAGGSAIPVLEQMIRDSLTPSRVAAQEDRTNAVHRAIGDLPDEQRLAVEARYLEGLPVKDIAERIGRSEGAVHQLLHRALRRLEQGIGGYSDYFSKKD